MTPEQQATPKAYILIRHPPTRTKHPMTHIPHLILALAAFEAGA